MSVVYFPSCKVTAYSPEASRKIKAYLQERFAIESVGCCRPGHKQITAEDTVVYICNTCAAFSNESSLAKKVISVWELLADDKQLILPDYGKRKMTLQDCWRIFDNKQQQNAVRKLLKKMNIEIVELTDNFAKTKYCGISLYEKLPEQNAKLAPKRFVENAPDMFKLLLETEQQQKMQENCANITTDEVVSYCVACAKGHEMGGKKSIHLLNLLYGNV